MNQKMFAIERMQITVRCCLTLSVTEAVVSRPVGLGSWCWGLQQEEDGMDGITGIGGMSFWVTRCWHLTYANTSFISFIICGIPVQ